MTTSADAAKPSIIPFDAVIVGAGMVGTALAGLLAEAGMQVALVEAKPSPLRLQDVADGVPAPRVSALTPVSQRLLTYLGAWPAMEAARVTPYRYMEVWDAEGSGRIRFSADEAGTATLGHIVENEVTLAALNEQVAKQPTLTRLDGVRVEALQTTARGRWLVLDDGRQLQTPLLVAADGARSALRALAGIPVAEESMAQEAVVTTVRCTHPHGGTARQAFLGGRPLAFLPLTVNGDDRYCSIVWSTTPEHAQGLTEHSPEALGKALGEAFEHRLGEVVPVDRAYRFPLVQRHAQHYVQPNFALVGDAAHSLHPLAGQGVNLGLMDAAVLAEEVVGAWRRGAPWGSVTTLSRFERRRRLNNATMLGLMKGFKQLFGSQQPVLTLARNVGMSGMNKFVPLKRLVMRQATGERGRLPISCR
ncbi:MULTISPECIES: UbiH/UbiF/VisC/COQ6 family ubiquinone biosynthesis hydroxylase [unclassified Halomonas]|uniref:UbiH/UbiF/VisC/COQ6 family ubiquinone biosynthesis hydroxylase n=1 Tax=unclassified Halomonas TaxID=2609666 RepID=UPI001EF55864|nr:MULTISPECIES: UbiH/UbiF/VisC/COQ6 family ubiquinone biosynthesis hydroxylase [unclassified Halomonas]MCG7577255.1 UbiH/UbiF/VisC/COQ6 family ubiquinone biosynthesis hydroxylase [Halomonas sp. MMH1-48]MCG7604320.1 UbiH/UbiF/VisC/COQ6 family ubiquinone biosynthesis hydroxylase [Halomonas sp. MM17-34]MCG7613671.1 UbiH/UbiF/VisC/COQ6 family ubiquinone biosynthesis hydroxylase [Halomonas sp. MM17-29]MCG7620343.1 UbiH/UbiF/VisC/COQ6 family ubiquinone biosynthesis hydroxylase [Halomonas sp. DSH1-27